MKTRQTCRYQNGDVSLVRPTTGRDGETITGEERKTEERERERERERGGSRKTREKGREGGRRETTELNKLEKHLSGQLMLLSRPLISPSPDFRRQIKALVPPGTANTFSTPPREIMRTRTHACTHAGTRSARLHATAIIAARQYARRGERRTEWRKNGTLLVFANDVPTCARRLARLGRFIETAAVPLAKMAARRARRSALWKDENSVNSPSRRSRATPLNGILLRLTRQSSFELRSDRFEQNIARET